MSKNAIWTCSNIDGFASASIFKDVDKHISHFYCTPDEMETSFKEWFDKSSDKYDKIYLLGFNVSQDFANSIDNPNIVLICVHRLNLGMGKTYTMDRYTSLTTHLYNIFKERLNTSSRFDELGFVCDELYRPNPDISLLMPHLMYFNEYPTKTKAKIANLYKKGLRHFTDGEKAILQRSKSKLISEEKHKCEYEGHIQDLSVYVVFLESTCPHIYRTVYLPKDKKYDLYLMVNPNTKKVTIFGGKETLKHDIDYVATRYFDGTTCGAVGYGTITTSFQKISEDFMEI